MARGGADGSKRRSKRHQFPIDGLRLDMTADAVQRGDQVHGQRCGRDRLAAEAHGSVFDVAADTGLGHRFGEQCGLAAIFTAVRHIHKNVHLFRRRIDGQEFAEARLGDGPDIELGRCFVEMGRQQGHGFHGR